MSIIPAPWRPTSRAIQTNTLHDGAVIALAAFLGYYAVTGLMGETPSYVIPHVGAHLLVYSPLLMYQFYFNRNLEELKTLGTAASWILAAYGVAYLAFLIKNPGIGRVLASRSLPYATILGSAYYAAYAAALACPFLLALWRYHATKRQIHRFAYASILVVCVLVVYLTGSTITMVAMAAGIVLSLVLFSRNRLVTVFFVAVVMVFFSLIRQSVGKFILDSQTDSSGAVAVRLRELGELIMYGETSGHGLDARNATYVRSIRVFLDYPVFGVGHRFGNNAAVAKMEVAFGNHSELFDTLAMYGLIGFILLAIVFWRCYRRIREAAPGLLVLPMVVTFGIMAMFNPLSCFHVSLLLMFVIPALLLRIKPVEGERPRAP
ncbi:MAG: O-antigen ligase family protein [Micrococcales bacterium]|nr:O-antigen ligase family protein [Micrococcales bacterium]